MSANITFPLILDENGDINLFLSKESLLTCTEVIDIDNDEYQVFDASGQTLQLTVVPSTWRCFGLRLSCRRPHLKCGNAQVSDPEAARMRLTRWLKACRIEEGDTSGQSLDELVQKCLTALEGK